jgi:hypothetical protein
LVKTDQRYGNYLVAFIDILGFKSIVEQSEEDQEYFNRILSALKHIEHFVIHNEGKAKNEGNSVNMTQFSDSLVISRPYTTLSLLLMIMNLDLIMKVLAREGIMIRGGLTSGYLYHEGNIAFGPAFIKAYELASKKAVFPRIIIDPDLLDGSSTPPPYGEPVNKDYLHVSTKGIIKQDKDGFHFIDFLGGYFSNPEFIGEELEKTILGQLLRLNGDYSSTERIEAKLKWMQEYINNCK